MILLAEKWASAASICSGVMVVPQFLDGGVEGLCYTIGELITEDVPSPKGRSEDGGCD